jgi:hypothetical protein
MAFDNNKIKFLQGTAEKLASLSSSEAGAFYLTNDTHELYVGLGKNQKPVALNRWVDIVKNRTEIVNIPAYEKTGKLYYVTEENILCTWDSTQGTWIQINPDTNTALNSVEISDGEKRDGSIAYTLTFKQTDKSGAAVEPDVTAELVITEDMVTSLIVDVEVDVTATVSNNIATITTTGTGSNGDGFKVKGTNGVTIETEEGFDGFVIDGTTYGLEVSNTTVQLKETEGNVVGSAEFIDDDKWIEVSNDNGKIKVAHIGSDSATKTSGTATKLEDEDTFEVVTGLTIEKGHVTGYQTTEYTVQDTKNTIDGSIESKDEVNQLKLDTKDENGTVVHTDYVDISSSLEVNGQLYTI